jgi:hypothetical protein
MVFSVVKTTINRELFKKRQVFKELGTYNGYPAS